MESFSEQTGTIPKDRSLSTETWTINGASYSAELVVHPGVADLYPDCYFCLLTIENETPGSIRDDLDQNHYQIQMWDIQGGDKVENARYFLQMIKELIEKCGPKTAIYIAKRAGLSFMESPGDVLIEPEGVSVGHSHFEKSGDRAEKITSSLHDLGVSSSTHPRVVDLGAGASPFYRMVLAQHGWSPENLVNLDVQLPQPNPVPGSTWLAVDLGALDRSLCGGWPIPPEVEQLKHTFHLIVMTFGLDWGPEATLPTVGDYFSKDQGLLVQNGLAGMALDDSGRWQSLITQAGEDVFWVNTARGEEEWFDIVRRYRDLMT